MEVSASLKKAIENYINGDQSAFNVIYNESHRYIYVCVNNVMSGNDNKEDMICDIMQETYLEICKHINSLQNVNQFLSWAGTIATRKCYEYIKKAGKYTLLNEDESFDTLADDDNIIPEEIMQNKEKQRLLREIIQNELTEMQKLCVVGYFYNEMKQSEIAKELGIPENSVKSHLLRAKAKIKESVLDLEKNKGTKLYSVAPLLLLLFVDEIKDCVVSPAIGQAVSASVGVVGVEVATAGAGATSVVARKGAVTTTGATASTAGANVATAAASAVKVKAIVIASVAAVAVGGIGAGVGIAVHNAKEDEPVNVVGTTENDESSEERRTEEVSTENSEPVLYYVADGATYYDASTKVTLTAGDEMPNVVEEGDVYTTADYTYTYDVNYSGWNVVIRDSAKALYEELLESVAGVNVTSMRNTFRYCSNLTTSPQIPSSVIYMTCAFLGCNSLTVAPEIPDGVTDMSHTFMNCESLTVAPEIPDSVTDMSHTFNGCERLTIASEIPDSVTNMDYTFANCENLIVAPKISFGITSMSYTFYNCRSLIETPKIPDGVTDMSYTFNNCKSLTEAPEIPDSVTAMNFTFDNCNSLTGTVTINANPEMYAQCFGFVDFVSQNLTLTGTSTMLEELRATA